ncbi:ferritin-like domain-containing protein [Anthocerotibacter panamensis]|uniref:ferritin-like domain-containing protein n=1 Tax=Anthocerotibacter panamensis TaxID=2857077 RepID=UPI001C40206F|nr:ferritin-like domain-containing protein [Anthocerotibacter panamensis]
MTTAARLSFNRFFSATERHRWNFERDIDWKGIRTDLLTPEELKTVRYAALVEGFTPTYAADLTDLFCGDAEMAAFLSIQYFEEYKHFHALRRYLELVAEPITDQEILARRSVRTKYTDKLVPILKFGVSEIYTAIFYRNLSQTTQEPVLKRLTHFIAQDEYRHLSFYLSYLEYLVRTEHIPAERITEVLQHYQHQGLEAIEDWVEFWQDTGRRYTRFEPYLVLQRHLSRIIGKSIQPHILAEVTSSRTLAHTFL